MAASERLVDRVAVTIEALASASPDEVPAAVERAPWLRTPEGLVRVAEEIARRMRIDLAQAERLAEAAAALLPAVDDRFALARAQRSIAHVHALRSRLSDAMTAYQSALSLFEAAGYELEAAVTRSGALLTLIYLGRYDEAASWAAQARRVFEAHGDRLRLARLDVNVGNIRYRQDRFEDARSHYARALATLQDIGDAQDVAMGLRNLAVCHISLHDFDRAVAVYRDARTWCESRGLAALIAEIDYNVAYLFYLRGEYARAIELYRVARERCVATGDPYHAALCDLDQAELYLEINLVQEGLDLAARAEAGFATLGMGYERAKALVNLAIGEQRRRRVRSADLRFARARRLFVGEGNEIWPALIDLYRALLLEETAPARAQRLCEAARAFFAGTALVSKHALSELVLARLHLRHGRVAEAQALASGAFARADHAGVRALTYQAAFVLGEVSESDGDRRGAYEWYRRAHGILEDLRGRLRHDELKIAFLKDKQAVFERLVSASLAGGGAGSGAREAFGWIEQAKSRGLAEQIAAQVHALPLPPTARPDTGDRLRQLRERLHWCHLEIERTEAEGRHRGDDQLVRLRREAQRAEGELVRLFQELGTGGDEFVSLQTADVVSIDAIEAAVPADGALLEYYEAQGRLYVAVLARGALEVVPLGEVSGIHEQLEFLRFQLSKFRLGPRYVERFVSTFEGTIHAHLAALYDAVLRPVRDRLQGLRHLVVVPHQRLHYLPFHALLDGTRAVMDDFAVSYAPSASVLHYCRTKPARSGAGALVLGVTDPRLPSVPEEVRAVASALPSAALHVGADATGARLREEGRHARYVHIATHGLFREDSPLFSSIRLADTQLTLFDLYHLRLDADLVTLSGCGTGLGVVAGGDEVIGLTRGLLFAGARAVLLTLWDVHDASAALLMTDFYGRVGRGEGKADALAASMRAARARWSHPYYWAPFVLVGEPG